MILKAVTLGCLLAASFDARLTSRRIKEYGVNVELSYFIPKMVKYLGADIASYIGCIFPTVGILGLCLYFNQPVLLGIYAGMRIKLFQMQIASLVFEKKLKAIASYINEHPELGADQDATLPSSNSDELPSQSAPTSSKEKEND